jgi:hypothetical protein
VHDPEKPALEAYQKLSYPHVKRTLSSFRYYHGSRTHLSLGKQCPFPREALKVGKIVAFQNSAAFVTDMNGLQHNFHADRLLASNNTVWMSIC